eukprot:SM000037S13508  [mRNA]  locus=s37:304109:305411:+ [translate_table: standard]
MRPPMCAPLYLATPALLRRSMHTPFSSCSPLTLRRCRQPRPQRRRVHHRGRRRERAGRRNGRQPGAAAATAAARGHRRLAAAPAFLVHRSRLGQPPGLPLECRRHHPRSTRRSQWAPTGDASASTDSGGARQRRRPIRGGGGGNAGAAFCGGASRAAAAHAAPHAGCHPHGLTSTDQLRGSTGRRRSL